MQNGAGVAVEGEDIHGNRSDEAEGGRGGNIGNHGPKASETRGNRILELLNGLEGGGGFDDDASEFFTTSAAVFEEDAEAVHGYHEDEETHTPVIEEDEGGIEDDSDPSVAPREIPSGGESRMTPFRPKNARRFRRRIHRRQAPLTRSQEQEEM